MIYDRARQLQNLSKILNLPVEEFFNPEQKSSKLGVRARVVALIDRYITGDDFNLSDRDLLNVIAYRIKEGK